MVLVSEILVVQDQGWGLVQGYKQVEEQEYMQVEEQEYKQVEEYRMAFLVVMRKVSFFLI